MKGKKLLVIFLLSMMLLIPTNSKAASNNYAFINSFNILDAASDAQAARDKEISKSVETTGELTEKYSADKETDDALNLCDDPNFVKLLKYIKTIISIIMYATAVVLVISIVRALIKEMTSDKAEVDKAIKTMGSKIVLAVIVFLLPTIVNWIFFTDNFITQKSNFLQTCISRMGDDSFLSGNS